MSDPKSMRRGKLDFIATKWPKAFMATATFQAAICLAFEAFVFATFQSHVASLGQEDDHVVSQYRSIPTFLTLFIFAFLYQLVLVWDALRMKNTIQIIGICASNVAILVYTAIQIDQIQNAVTQLRLRNLIVLKPGETDLWPLMRPYLLAIPCIIALTSVVMGVVAYKLYQVFAWDILKQIGADYRMKKRFLAYQVYIALLKFDFFFFLGFTVQFLVIVTGTGDAELGLTVAAIPITIFILLFAALFTRREMKPGMIIVVCLYFGGLAYFFFKLVRIYQPGYKDHYTAVQRSLTAFAVLTIILIILTIVNAFVCMNNFGAGLKAHILKKSPDLEKPADINSIGLNDFKPQLPSRMTID